MGSSKFRQMYLEDIMAVKSSGSRLKAIEIGGPTYVDLPLANYGDKTIDIPKVESFRIFDTWDFDRYLAMPPCVFIIEDCVLHTGYGLLTIDDCIATESTSHFPDYFFEKMVKRSTDDDENFDWHIEEFDSVSIVNFAVSCHYGINENYYHWLVLFFPKLCVDLLEVGIEQADGMSPAIIFPPLSLPFQNDSANVVARSLKMPYIVPDKYSRISVKNLIYPIPERGIGLTPHPIIRDTLRRLRDEMLGPEFPGADRIFISRWDTGNRKISNEVELEHILSDLGFLIVVLSELSLQQQISLFAKAKIIIGQHGAGLTNICFCDPGAKLLELHNPSYQNWCYRRLSALFSVEYGFLFGEELNAEPSVHVSNLIMSVNLEKVVTAVSEMIN